MATTTIWCRLVYMHMEGTTNDQDGVMDTSSSCDIQNNFFCNFYLTLNYFCYSKRKRGYEEDGHVAKEPRLAEEVRQYSYTSLAS